MHKEKRRSITCVVHTHKQTTKTTKQTNTMGPEIALCSVAVDVFFMKAGAVCQNATHGFQLQRSRAVEKQTMQQQKELELREV